MCSLFLGWLNRWRGGWVSCGSIRWLDANFSARERDSSMVCLRAAFARVCQRASERTLRRALLRGATRRPWRAGCRAVDRGGTPGAVPASVPILKR